MATHADVRRIALSLPGTVESEADFSFAVVVKGKAMRFVWLWRERVHPKKPKVRNPKVLAVRTGSLDDKEFLLRADPKIFFTESHYDGYPAVLVRLPEVRVPRLREILTEAWRVHAPADSTPKRRR
ncbi:MAG TPA: hypothetical protein VFI13_08265 [Gemmatimonadales bacterium]|nr:hypothetical protein [Gemmatimonadales bacterium]